jgi:hypothetical protein
MTMLDVAPAAVAVEPIAVFEKGAWFAAVRVRGDDDEAVEVKVFRDFAFDYAHQAVRAARTRAAGFHLFM